MKATFVADVSHHYAGHAELFLLEEAKTVDGGTRKYYFIVVATLNTPYLCKTGIVPSDMDGIPVDFRELPGSYEGGTDIDKALSDAGYEVVREK